MNIQAFANPPQDSEPVMQIGQPGERFRIAAVTCDISNGAGAVAFLALRISMQGRSILVPMTHEVPLNETRNVTWAHGLNAGALPTVTDSVLSQSLPAMDYDEQVTLQIEVIESPAFQITSPTVWWYPLTKPGRFGKK